MAIPIAASPAAITVGVMAGVAAAAWLIQLALLARATRPKFASPLAGGIDLLGDEPAALANFLVDWRVSDEAVPATVVDLAARGYIAVDRYGPGRFVIRLRRESQSADALTNYERRVLNHIRSLAVDNMVPAAALSTGPQDQSKRWWRDFKAAVVDDAKRRGLARPRWGRGLMILLEGTALVPAILSAIAVALAEAPKKAGEDDDNPLAVAFFVWMLLSAVVGALRNVRDTHAGLELQARLLGLKHYLAQNEQFAIKDPSSVAIWDRYLAYAVAMGLDGAAARALPMGTQSPTTQWSAHGGTWREVRLRYPSNFWAIGRRPLLVVIESLLVLGIGLPVATSLVPALFRAVVDLVSVRDVGPLFALLALGALMFLTMAAAILLFLGRGLVLLIRSVRDLGPRRVVEGIVLRKKDNLVLIYDGKDPTALALRLPTGAPSVSEGSIVRGTISPQLKHLSKIEVVRPPREAIVDTSASSIVPDAEDLSSLLTFAAAQAWLGEFILEQIRAETRLPFHSSSQSPMPIMRRKGRGVSSSNPVGVYLFEAPGHGRIGVALAPEEGLVGRGLEDSRLIKLILRPRSIQGIGNWAKWYRGGTLIVQFDRSRLVIWVRMKGYSSDRRLGIARNLATKVIDRVRAAAATSGPAKC